MTHEVELRPGSLTVPKPRRRHLPPSHPRHRRGSRSRSCSARSLISPSVAPGHCRPRRRCRSCSTDVLHNILSNAFSLDGQSESARVHPRVGATQIRRKTVYSHHRPHLATHRVTRGWWIFRELPAEDAVTISLRDHVLLAHLIPCLSPLVPLRGPWRWRYSARRSQMMNQRLRLLPRREVQAAMRATTCSS